MKKNVLLGVIFFSVLAIVSLYAAGIPKGLIDSKPDNAILLSLDEFFKNHPPKSPGLNRETIFTSPRSTVILVTAVKGTSVGAHFHSTADEIVLIKSGSGELLVNGKWIKVKAGDIHVNPRGNIHDTRALSEDLRFVSIFTPPQPQGGDANMIK